MNGKWGRKMKCKISSILLAFVVFVLLSTAASAAVKWDISPSNPFVGDTLIIKGTASPGENVKAAISFGKTIAVSNGQYRYLLENVKIPTSTGNSFTVKTTGVQNLNVGVKDVLWITKTAGASGGVATISQANIPAGTYKVLISGNALKGKSSVNAMITASQTLKADSKGSFTYSYDTSSLPAGKYIIKIGNIEKTVELKPKK
jgi:hypothetical protein